MISGTPTTAGTFNFTVRATDINGAFDDQALSIVASSPLVSVDLSLTKTDSPDPVGVGGSLTYTLTVTNPGPDPATGVILTDTLPGSVTFGSATPSQGSCSGTATITCGLATLSPGAMATVTIVVTPTAAGIITNTATVTANETDANTANNMASAKTTVFTAGSISGVVTDGTNPIAGATVTAFPDASGTIRSALTALNGIYTITGFVPGNYRVQAQADNFFAQWYSGKTNFSAADLVVVNAGATTANINFTLTTGVGASAPGGITGRVTQTDGTTGIPNVEVIVSLATVGGRVLSTTTDALGFYNTGRRLAPGSFKALARGGNGFASLWFDNALNFGAATVVTVPGGGDATGINFRLPANAGGITGRVTEAGTGATIAGAIISIFDAATNSIVIGRIATTTEGTYSTGRVLAPGTYKVGASKVGFAATFYINQRFSGAADPVTVVADADTANINIALTSGGISGRVTNALTGAPLSGATIDIFDAATNVLTFGGFTTALDGTYTTGGFVPAGNYKVRARLAGFVDTFYVNGVDLSSATQVGLAAMGAPNIDIALPSGGTIRGTIRDRMTTAAIAGATVAAFRVASAGFFSVATDSSGNFTISGLRDGDWLVRAQASGHILGYHSGDANNLATDTGTATPIRISGGNTVTANLNLQPGGGTLSGQVTRSDNGQPVPFTNVNVNGLFPRLFLTGFVINTTTDVNGNYTFTGLPTGQYIVSALGRQEAAGTALGFYPTGTTNFSTALPVSVTDGMTTSGVNFAIPAFGGTDTPRTISGTVRDSSGNPIPFASVAVIDPFSQVFIRSTVVSGNGSYTLTNLPPGKYLVRAFTETTFETSFYNGQHLAAAGTPVDVTFGNAAGIDFSLPATAGIMTGRVTRSDTGQPIAGAGIQVRNFFDNSLGGATTRQDGTFLVRGLPPGFYKVRVNAPGFVTRYYTLSGSGGTTADDASFVEVTSSAESPNINVVLVPGAGSITGTVKQEMSLQAVPNAAVNIREATSGGTIVTLITGQDGSYEAPVLATGSYKLRVTTLDKALEWYSDKDTREQADAVAVSAPGTTSGVDFVLSLAQGTISGQIFRNDGTTPLADAGVVIFDTATGGFVTGGGVTDTQGRYTVRGLPPGLNRYVAQARALGFAPQFFTDVPGRAAATPISVASDTPGINFNLTLTSTIAGTISYSGSQTGALRIGLFSDPALTRQVYGRFISSPVFPQVYIFSNPPPDTQGILPGTYFVAAFIDSNGNGVRDATEAAGLFGAATPHGGTPVVVGENATQGNRNFTLVDPSGPAVGPAISGRVTQDDGVTPIAGATVTAFPEVPGTFGTAMTAADGTYMIVGLLAGNYRVSAQADTFVTQWYSGRSTFQAADLVVVLPGAATTGIDFALSPGAGGISGRVTQEGGIAGISGVPVLVRLAAGGFVLSATTDPNGFYNTGRRVAPGSYKVQAGGTNGFAALFFNGKLSFGAADPVSVGASADTAGIDFQLPTSVGGITGFVTDADTGAPLVGARVDVFDPVTNSFVLAALVTGGDGSYATGQRLLAPGNYKVRASFPGRASTFYVNRASVASADLIFINVGADTPNINMALAAGGITGRVTSAPTGAPISGATIDFFDAATNALAFGGFATALDGTFSTGEFVPAGTYKVRARALGFADRFYVNGIDLLSATPVTRLAGQNTPNVNIALPLVGTIRGTILDRSTGLPIVGAFVTTFRVIGAGFFNTTTDGAGNFTIAGVPDGEWLVRATAAGHILGYFSGDPNNLATDTATATPLRISGGNTLTANLNLQPGGGTLSGRVTRSDNPSQGVAGTSVNASGLFPRTVWTGFVNGTVTDGNGYYTLTGLPTGHYVVQAAGIQAPGGTATGFYPTGAANFGTALPVSVTDGATTSGVDFAIPGFTTPEAPRTISGTVRDGSGNPIALAGVAAIDPFTTLAVRSAAVNSDGTYTLTGLPPGKYLVRVATERTFQTTFHNGQHVFIAATPVDVTGGNATGIDFSLPADAGTMTGRVTRSDTGQPIMGALVQVRNFFDNTSGGATSRRDGTFLARGLPPGFYKVRVSAPGLVTRYFTVSGSGGAAFDNGSFITVTGSQNTLNINVSLDPGPGSITGTVRRQEDLQPLGNALVQVRDAASGSTVFIAVTAVDGSYELPILRTGTYKLRVTALDRATQWFSGKDTREAGDTVSVTAPGIASGVDFVLSPTQGSISGQVFRSDGVTPLADAGVLVFDAATGGLVVGGGVTDTQGRYTARGLAPGTNRYVAQARALGYAPKFFGNVPNRATAAPISVASDTPGINFTLTLSSTISGTINYFGAQTGPLRVGLFSDSGLTRQVYETTIPSPVFPQAYSFSLPPPDTQGIVPGTYFAAAFIDGNGNRVRDVGEAAGQFGGVSATPVVVAENQTQGSRNFMLLDSPVLPLVSADVSVTKVESAGQVLTGSTLLYTLTVRNAGPNAAAAVSLADAIPAGTTFASGTTDQGTCSTPPPGGTGTVMCSLGDLIPNDTVTVSLVVNVTAAAGSTISNTASVTTATPDPNSANNSDTATSTVVSSTVGAISGLVTQADGVTSISGATVSANPVAPGGTFGSATTAADGTYTITGLAFGNYRVQVQAAGFPTMWFNGRISAASADLVAVMGGATTAGINFALPAGGAIAGFVTDSTGFPLPGPVIIDVFDAATFAFVAGGFTSVGINYGTGNVLAPGAYKVRARLAGFATTFFNQRFSFFTADAVTVRAGQTTTAVNFALAAAGGISGRITDTGAPPAGVDGATVDVRDASTNVFVAGGFVSGPDGSYTTGLSLPPGTYKVLARPTGFATTYFNQKFDFGTADAVTVQAGLVTSNVNFALGAGGGITGRVNDASTGAPLGGVIIDVFDAANAFLIGGFPTAVDGTYATGRRLAAGAYKLRARFPGYIHTFHASGVDFATATPVSVTANADTPNIHFLLPPGGTISGRILERGTNIPLVGAAVFAQRFRASNFFGTFGVRTDQNGNFTIGGLHDGDWLVRAEAPGHVLGYFSGNPDNPAPDFEAATVIQISGANSVGNANLNLQMGGGGLQGRVTRSDTGQPLPRGVFVTIRGPFPRTNFTTSTPIDNDGIYAISGLPTGRYVVEASGIQAAGGTAIGWFPTGSTARGTALFVSVTDGATTTGGDFAVQGFSGGASPRRISGRVRDGNGNPVTATFILVADPASVSFVRVLGVNGDGTYTADQLSPGRYLIQAIPEAVFLETRVFDAQLLLAAGTLVDITLGDQSGKDLILPETGGSMTGTVTSSTGQPVMGASVSVRTFFDNPVGLAVTRHDGTFLVRGRPPGFYKVQVTSPGSVTRYYTASGTGGQVFDQGSFVEVVSRQATPNINVQLAPGNGAIAGRVLRQADGQPVVGAIVQVREATTGGTVLSVASRADGSYEAFGLAPASYNLRIITLAPLGVAIQWFNGKDTRDTADTVAVTSPATSTACTDLAGRTDCIDFSLDAEQGSLSGQIFRSDGVTPLAGAGVVILDAATGGFVGAGGITGTPGQYTVHGLPPGPNRYVAQARALGFAPKFFTDAPSRGGATPISVASDTPGINFALTRSSDITGTISYTGSQSGPLRVGLFADVALTQRAYSLTIPSPVFPQAYSFSLPPPDTQGIIPGTYFVAAFIDSNLNGGRDASEASGQFGGAPPIPVVAAENDTQGFRDFTLSDAPPPSGTADLFLLISQSLTGGTILYTLTVTNNGPDPATGVTVVDTVPVGTTFASATPSQGSCSTPLVGGTGTVSCSLGDLPAGGTATVILVVNVVAVAGATVTNTASVAAATTDPFTFNNLAVEALIVPGLDSDGDGVDDSVDNCPLTFNPDQADTDRDGIGDACDDDLDGDGVPNAVDNCPLVYNPPVNWVDKFGGLHINSQPDFDLDGIGDACDDDADGDGFISVLRGGNDCNDADPNIFPGQGCGAPVPPAEEPRTSRGTSTTTVTDTDGDGVPDSSDNCPKTPNPPKASWTDKNGVVHTNSQSDFDLDGIGDECDTDQDGDGVNDKVEDPAGSGTFRVLTAAEGADNCPMVPNPKTTWTDKNGVVHVNTQPDFDLDGKGDACDEDADGDGFIGVGKTHPITGAAGDDCNDLDPSVHPGATEILNNGKDDDCNPATPDRAFEIVFSLAAATLSQGIADYDAWLPTDGASATIVATVVDSAGNPLSPQPSIAVSVVSITNIPGKYSNDPNVADTSSDFDVVSIGGNQIQVISRDYGGLITFRASTSFPTADGLATIMLEKLGTHPKDLNGNGIADSWENQYGGNLSPTADLDTIPNNTNVGDGLTVRQEYRGFIWGPALVRVDPIPGGVYQTTAFLPTGPTGHFRTNPTRKDVFVKHTGFTTTPFAVGAALDNAGVDVHVRDASPPDPGEANIDVILVQNVNRPFGLDDCHINWRGPRDWTWDTKGATDFIGTSTIFGTVTHSQASLDCYFSDRPYRDGGAMVSGVMVLPPNGVLDPRSAVEDGNDNATLDVIQGKSEDKNANRVLDGDLRIIGWETNQQRLSQFDINNNAKVELPVVSDVSAITIEYTKEQVLKHTLTHEIVHAMGGTHNSCSTCLMFDFTPNWSRDENLSAFEMSQILIHNQP